MRDSEAQIMRVCRGVQTEPTLLPINENDYERKVNTADNAREGWISLPGVCRIGRAVRKLFDIRITHGSHILSQSLILGSP